ncbi:hypothetical protein GQE99_01060 [Maritimibacter sp. DP07]|jgi:hybrid cluster-associated redox disulfide protein|uniref:Hybrid cluster protein-associated redox disulfide domain-containing protein n=1 Tax=Maritimibacter harenae TaxID=2606218 RepID=A0A845M293_9RHOB|nr:hypothetical protein [Maritimibacter harenae]MZR11623.1 hypothetical protein [Maritimibacter harenae]
MRRRPDFDDPDLPLATLFATWPDLVEPFIARKMLCPGCLVAPFHTITDACEEYDLEEDAFRAELRARVAEKL